MALNNENHRALRAVAKFLISDQDADVVVVRESDGNEHLEVDGTPAHVFADGFPINLNGVQQMYVYSNSTDAIHLFTLTSDRWILEETYDI